MMTPDAVDERDFLRDFARYCRQAQRGPLAILRNGAVAGYFIQRDEYEELFQTPRSFATSDLPEEKVAAIAAGRMNPRHDHLDALLDEP